MQKVAKKYSLKVYFKSVMYNYSFPQNPREFLDYAKEHGEIPIKDLTIEDKDWFYKVFVEFQKRIGVFASQYFTPPKTAERMAEIADDYVRTEATVLDACCGFGQITKYMKLKGFETICGFDISYDMYEHYRAIEKQPCENNNIAEYKCDGEKFKLIISNPPYEVRELTQFFEQLPNWLERNGIVILLILKAFMEKKSPANLYRAMDVFQILHREDMAEDFFNTKVKAEIVVLAKK